MHARLQGFLGFAQCSDRYCNCSYCSVAARRYFDPQSQPSLSPTPGQSSWPGQSLVAARATTPTSPMSRPGGHPTVGSSSASHSNLGVHGSALPLMPLPVPLRRRQSSTVSGLSWDGQITFTEGSTQVPQQPQSQDLTESMSPATADVDSEEPAKMHYYPPSVIADG